MWDKLCAINTSLFIKIRMKHKLGVSTVVWSLELSHLKVNLFPVSRSEPAENARVCGREPLTSQVGALSVIILKNLSVFANRVLSGTIE